jgi:uncharacterized protein involved in type VI secretion and phage assembly
VAGGLIDAALAGLREAVEPRIYGVTVAEVIDNIDATGAARVQLRLPWMPGYEPWARVAAVVAGDDQGVFFIPQVGDEVLVAFNHGDVRDPYVIGGLWNRQDSPPAAAPNDAVSRRIVRTPAGHEIELDDLAQSVTVTSSSGQEIRLEPSKVELQTADGTAKVTLETAGKVSIEAQLGLELKAPSIKLDGTTVELKATANATVDGGGACTVKAGVVRIN